MFWNYIKTSYRSLIRQKSYSFINISGLALGLAGFILISIWILNELSYDQFHLKKERIFRLNTVNIEAFDNSIVTTSSWRLGPALEEKYSEVESFTRLWPWDRTLVQFNDKSFEENRFYLADPAFFSIFTFPFKYGTADNALKDKYSIILSESAARRYFDDENPVGKFLYVKQYDSMFEVGGIVYDAPENSSIQFDFVARVDLMPQQRLDSWEFTGFTVVLLKENIDQELFEQKIFSFYRDYVNAETEYSLVLQPLTNIHLYFEGTPGLIKQVYLFSIIAVFILLIACINFMNLSTARAAKRAREVGIRKVVGARRYQLIQQFLAESVILTVAALLLAVLLIEILLPYFNQFTAKNLTLFYVGVGKTIGIIIVAVLFTGLVSGSYPAFYLSVYNPVKILKNAPFSTGYRGSFRKTLTVVQFTISIFLIICTIFVYRQLHFIQNKDLGMSRKQVIHLYNNPALNEKFVAYREELMKNNLVSSVSASAVNPFNVGQVIDLNWAGHYDQEEIPVRYTMVDYDYFKTMEMTIVKGRSFSKEFPADETEACIINETALKIMNLTNPLGHEVYFNHPAFNEDFKRVKIIGVVKDFHFQTLHHEIGPFVFRIYRPWHFNILMRLSPENMQQKINRIEQITKKFAPEYPFQYQFLDDMYNQIYADEKRLGTLFNVFTVVAIFISSLGLFGLSSYLILQRTKEIGIRKVLGASAGSIISLLSNEFSALLLMANLISWPVAAYFIYNWLQNYTYRIDMQIWEFIAAGLLAFLIALLTVGYQSGKAALSKPVHVLRYE